jgi:hypothetical protein
MNLQVTRKTVLIFSSSGYSKHAHTIHQQWAQYALYLMEGVFSALTGYIVNQLSSFFITQKHKHIYSYTMSQLKQQLVKISTDNAAGIISTVHCSTEFQ